MPVPVFSSAGEEHLLVAEAMGLLGTIHAHAREFGAGEPLLIGALALERRLREIDHPATADLLYRMGSYHYMETGDFAAAERCLREALEIFGRVCSEDHMIMGQATAHLAWALVGLHQLEEAAALLRRTVDHWRGTIPEFLTLRYIVWHAEVQRSLGDLAAAEALYRRSLAELPQGAIDHGQVRTQLASLVAATGRSAEGERLFRKALELWSVWSARAESAGARERRISAYMFPFAAHCGLAELLDQRGEQEEALTLCSELLPRGVAGLQEIEASDRKLHIHKRLNRGELEQALGVCLAIQGRHDDAESHLVRSVQAYESSLGRSYYRFYDAVDRVARFYDARADPGKAAEYRARRRGATYR